MNDLWDLFKAATPATAVLIAAAYLLKVYLDKRLEGLAGRLAQIAQTSLDIKKDLRGEERGELVAFRVAIEEWSDFLLRTVFDFTMIPAQAAQIENLYQRDNELFLKVKVAVVKVGIYLRDSELEQRLMDTVIQLRRTYYPLINAAMPALIDLQTRLAPLQAKLSAFVASNMTDMAVAPTERDRDDHAALQTQINDELRRFAGDLTKVYPRIAEYLHELKEAINAYIYRPIHRTAVNKE